MTAPVTYTDAELAGYMARSLGTAVVDSLGWTTADNVTADDLGDYEELVLQTKIELGVSDISEMTSFEEIKTLRAVASWQVWEAACRFVSDRFDENTGSTSYRRSQQEQMICRRAASLRGMAMALLRRMPDYIGETMKVGIVPRAVLVETKDEFGS